MPVRPASPKKIVPLYHHPTDLKPQSSTSTHVLDIEQVFLPIERIVIHALSCGKFPLFFVKPGFLNHKADCPLYLPHFPVTM